MPDRARLAAHSAGQQNEFKTLTTCPVQPWDETQDRGVATLHKAGCSHVAQSRTLAISVRINMKPSYKLSRNNARNTSKDNAVLGITGSIDSGKKSPFFLDKPSGGAAPPVPNVKPF